MRVVERARQQLTDALLAGDESRCRQIAIDLYLAEHTISVICDEVFAAAFRGIGDRWACGDAQVYQERRSCEISLRVLHEFRKLLAPPPPTAPLAIGGAPMGDQYTLGTGMAELVLRDVKWQATSLGSNLPFETLAEAIRQSRPQLFWLSCSHIADAEEFLQSYRALYDEFSLDVAFVVGGYALTENIRRQMKFSAYCDNMQHLEGFGQTLCEAIGKRQEHTARQGTAAHE
jgi:methanogenic corrinoid protein MtbC1